MNYSTILASLLDGISLALKSGNSNVDAEQFNFLTDAINKSTIIPSYFDRENAIKYLDVSDTEFARLTYKGTKFHPVQPLLSPVRVQGMTKPVYLKETLDALKNNGLIRPKKSRGKYKTKKLDNLIRIHCNTIIFILHINRLENVFFIIKSGYFICSVRQINSVT